MEKLTRFLNLFIAALLLSGGLITTLEAAPKKKKKVKLPAWTLGEEHPDYPRSIYWYAPGEGPDLVSASDQARAQVTAQLQVQIKSVVTSTEEELIEEDRSYYSAAYKSTVESLVDESIQGIEIVQTHKASGVHYALAVLNRSIYLGALEAELRDYAQQLETLYQDAGAKLDKGEVFAAIENLSDAVDLAPEVYPRQSYFNALSDVNFNLQQSLQSAALLSHVRDVISDIDLTLVSGADQVSAPGQRLPRPIIVQASLNRQGGSLAISEMPLRAYYASGDRAAKLATTADGRAEVIVSAVPGDRPDAGYVTIKPNLGRMPEIMGPLLVNLELRVNFGIEGEVAAFAVMIKDSQGQRLENVEADIEAIVLKSGFRIDPKSSLVISGEVSQVPIKRIEVGTSASFQAEARLRLEVIEKTSGATKASMEVNKKTVAKTEKQAAVSAMQDVGGSVKRKALTEMLGDALAD